jgi:TrwC relaxase
MLATVSRTAASSRPLTTTFAPLTASIRQTAAPMPRELPVTTATLDYLATHAGYARVGHHGGAAGRFIDAHDWTVASFFQHDSRDHDPQLHIHNAVLNRVQGTDGVWRTLHGRALYTYRGAASAVGERTMDEHLTASLGVRFASRPDGRAREILGLRREVIDLFSSRRRAITAKTTELVGVFETRFDRPPNSLELTGCSGWPPSPPATPSRTRGRRSSSGWTGGTPNYGPRSPTGWPASPPTSSRWPGTARRPSPGRRPR